MKEKKFKGLEKALSEGCYIIVNNNYLNYPMVRVEKVNKITKKESLEIIVDNANVLAALNSASNKIINQMKKEVVFYDRCNLDSVVEDGYYINIYKLSNEKILSSICEYSSNAIKKDSYNPVLSVITDDIYTGVITLNNYLNNINIDDLSDTINNNLTLKKSNK